MCRFVVPLVLGAFLCFAPAHAGAAQGDCAQPVTSGDGPVATDCLFVLRTGVGSASCELCVCDANDNAAVSASDALLCLRVAVGQPAELTCPPCEVCVGPLEATEETFSQLFLDQLDDEGNFEPEPICATDDKLCCPGGVPSDPCGPIHFDLTDVSFQVPVGTNRVDLTLVFGVETVSDLSVNIPLAGTCGIAVDTAPGTSPTIRLDVQLLLDSSGVVVEGVANQSLTGLTTDDVELHGGIGCQIANLGLSFYIDQLTDVLADRLQQFEGACLGHLETPE
jgi:hypothetical protein